MHTTFLQYSSLSVNYESITKGHEMFEEKQKYKNIETKTQNADPWGNRVDEKKIREKI